MSEVLGLVGLVISMMSAMAQIVQAYNSKKTVSRSAISKSKKRATSPIKSGVKQVAKVMDNKLLEAFSMKIQGEYNKLISSLESPTATKEDIEKAIHNAKQSICFYLIQIMKHNQGKLPTQRLKNYFYSHGCKIYTGAKKNAKLL